MPGPESSLLAVDPAKLDDVVRLVEEGSTLIAAARAVGLRPKTVQKWVERGSDEGDGEASAARPDEAVVEFARRVRRAQGLVEGVAVGVIVRAAKDGDWRAAAWFLERSPATRERWAREQADGGEGGGVTLLELARAAAGGAAAGAMAASRRGELPRVGSAELVAG
jgi:hypothetical protein